VAIAELPDLLELGREARTAVRARAIEMALCKHGRGHVGNIAHLVHVKMVHSARGESANQPTAGENRKSQAWRNKFNCKARKIIKKKNSD
jgi:hypothetical protein